MRTRMLTSVVTLLTALAALLAAVLLSPAPAHAAQGVIRDGRDAALPAQMDILRVDIRNRADKVVLRLTFRDLVARRKAQTKVFIGTRPGTDEGFIAYSGYRPASGAVTQLWQPTDQEFGGVPIACAGIKGRWRFDRNTVRIVVPQACLASSAARYRFKAVAGFYRQTGDYTAFRSIARD
ncbi:hypothetical protein F9L07_14400 [Pimelobacter simplex]|uniref:Secreted protein n=1 Tax=Nocardioides simplex TaxID=2045 RepID=A0A7J5E3R2_NOCSI|nr:hypothetical protein [Pimelobacter simplex]KAB2812895.1 hypothetical protein F9L07_14400 [Pimelobacter simplex]